MAVEKDGVPIRRAAERYNVPKSTLHDRISGRVQFGSTSGPESYLNEEEERELVQFIEACTDIGFSRTKSQIIELVQRVMMHKKKDVNVSLGWWTSFRRRHPHIVLRSPESVSHVRAIGTRREILQRYFDLLEETFTEYDLYDKPTAIFNMDETGMPLNPVPPKVLSRKGTHHPVTRVSADDKSRLTVVSCCNAAGYTIPPMVILDRKRLPPEFSIGEVPGTIYGLSSNGWMDSELFDLWFRHHFLAYAPPTRPVLLLLDGHSSHYNLITIEKAAKEDVIMFCLPPHSSHINQPLDKGVFGPLKRYWRQECHNFLVQNPGRVVTRHEFSQLFSKAWCNAMSMTNIMGGFKTTGIFPLSREVLLPPIPSHDNLLSKRTAGLPFIPLVSPARRLVRESTRVPDTPSSTESCEEETLGPNTDAFTAEEEAIFQKRFEEGYDIQTDSRYNQWLNMHHPFDPDLSSITSSPPFPSVLSRSSSLSMVLPSIKMPELPEPKTSSRVLTNSENLKILREKDELKREKEALKEERKRKRELAKEEKKMKQIERQGICIIKLINILLNP